MYCWRNPCPDVSMDDNATWPELSSENKNRYTRPDSHQPAIATSMEIAKVELGRVEYPELTPQPIKSKQTAAITRTSNVVNVHERTLYHIGKSKRFCITRTKSKRTEKICINLQEILQKIQKSKNCAKGTLDKRLNESKVHGESKKAESKLRKTETYYFRIKKPSRLKRIILLERENRRYFNGIKHGLRSRKREPNENVADVDSLNLKMLKIIADPEIDVNYVKHMSSLSIYGKDYRDPGAEDSLKNAVDIKRDIINKFQGLSVKSKAETSVRNFVHQPQNDFDPEILQKTLSLAINDDTEKNVENSESRENEQPLKFTKNFREYCTNIVSPSLNAILEKLLAELKRLQRRLYERDCTKGKYKRRYYLGLKETQKHVELKKVKFVLIAPDLERVELPGGLNEQVCKLLDACRKHGVPVCFGLRRRKLGYYTHGKGIVACVGIANYGGLEDIFKDVLIELLQARSDFKRLRGEPEKVIDLTTITADENLLVSESIALLLRHLISGY